MSGLEVLGAPDPGLPREYRGTSRDGPTVMEHLGLNHPANRLFLELLDQVGEERIQDVVVARRLTREFGAIAGSGPWDIVEIVSHGEQSRAGGRRLGFDVPFRDGLYSLLAAVLLWSDPFAVSSNASEADPRVAGLRVRFVGRLNENRLFATEEEALAFLAAAEEVGPWEGPDIEWEVVGLWLVDDPAD